VGLATLRHDTILSCRRPVHSQSPLSGTFLLRERIVVRMPTDAMVTCSFLWAAFLLVWVVWGLKTKPIQSRESASSRLPYMLLTIAGAYLMLSGNVRGEFLRAPIFNSTTWTNAVGIAITVAGLAFAIWARAYLGGNWSSAVTVKIGHQLIRTGPYRWVRHPIYTGMISAMVGTAIVRDQVRAVIAVVLLYLGFKLKSKIEERTMTETFGAQYEDYSRTTGAIVPRLWS
jgi:protein-S-isoprenylcysteine O-methyltransferase Ste14